MPFRIGRTRGATSGLALAALLSTGFTGQAFAASGQPDSPHAEIDFVNGSAYQLDFRSAGIEVGTQIPGQTFQDVGFSQVRLTKDIGNPQGYCEALGAVEFAGNYVEEGVLGLGAAPPDAGSVKGGYQNPVLSRSVKPELNAEENLTNREPSVKNPSTGEKALDIPHDGNPIKTAANCASDTKGASTGHVGNLAGIAEYVASSSSAEVSRSTSTYVGTSRAVVGGIQGAGALDTISSFMQVTSKPGKEPTVTYRLSFFESGAVASFNQNAFTVSGTNVPASDLVKQFNDQAKTASAALAAVGPVGFTLLAPEVGTANVPEQALIGLPYITAPAIQMVAGAALREGTAGQQENVRLASVTFTGSNG
ncbi:MAG: hypothetical protein ACT4QF_01815 [Sporichthyaceae bacterium]